MSDDPLVFLKQEWWPIKMRPDPVLHSIYERSLGSKETGVRQQLSTPNSTAHVRVIMTAY